jgi:hypothetical protein
MLQPVSVFFKSRDVDCEQTLVLCQWEQFRSPSEKQNVKLPLDKRADHSSKWVGINGRLSPFRPKKRDPPTLSSEALLSKKITKNVRKRAKISKNAKSR